MGKDSKYQKERKQKDLDKCQAILEQLPQFINDYMNSIITDRSPRTLIAYAYDFKIFFEFLINCNTTLSEKKIDEITLQDLDRLTINDLNNYKKYLSSSNTFKKSSPDHVHVNDNKAIARKIVPLKKLFHYYEQLGELEHDYMQFVARPKIEKDKNTIVFLSDEEVGRILECVTYGKHLSDKQLETFEKTKYRDIAIIYLFLETGIRVSECRGIDIADIDMEKREIVVVRKGGGQDSVYFGDDVATAITDYMTHVRNNMTTAPGHEEALFISTTHKTRLSVRALENVVAKYTQAALGKAYYPHKLRSTCGSKVYQISNDIKLVADILGNTPNVASRYYAKQGVERQRDIANVLSYKVKDNEHNN